MKNKWREIWEKREPDESVLAGNDEKKDLFVIEAYRGMGCYR